MEKAEALWRSRIQAEKEEKAQEDKKGKAKKKKSKHKDVTDLFAQKKSQRIRVAAPNGLVPVANNAAYMCEEIRTPQGSGLRRVNILEDPEVWVVLDEGCKSSMHSSVWGSNAEEKFRKTGHRHQRHARRCK